jgi:hypothetical protein
MDTKTVDIDTLEAGAEMNLLVAEKVMGWQLRVVDKDGWYGGYMAAVTPDTEQFLFYLSPNVSSGRERWMPSTDIRAAFEVVDYLMATHDTRLTLTNRMLELLGPYVAEFEDLDTDEKYRAYGATAPEAICRAALKVLG